jgi:hypothetical protein
MVTMYLNLKHITKNASSLPKLFPGCAGCRPIAGPGQGLVSQGVHGEEGKNRERRDGGYEKCQDG